MKKQNFFFYSRKGRHCWNLRLILIFFFYFYFYFICRIHIIYFPKLNNWWKFTIFIFFILIIIMKKGSTSIDSQNERGFDMGLERLNVVEFEKGWIKEIENLYFSKLYKFMNWRMRWFDFSIIWQLSSYSMQESILRCIININNYRS